MTAPKAFGRRGTQKFAATSSSGVRGHGPADRRRSHPTSRQTTENGTYEFRYTPKLTWAGILLLAPIVDGTMGLSTNLANGAADNWEQWLFSLTPWIVAVLGAFWVVTGLRGGLALKVAPEGASAMTLYGPAFHKWENVGRMTVRKKPGFVGDQIASLFGADTSSLSTEVTLYPTMGLSTWYRTPIEVRVDNTNTSLEEILAAIGRYRPDLVEQPSWI